MAEYKPSMFNRIVEHDGEMLLYNSRLGNQSITFVNRESHDYVKELLKSPSEEQNDDTYKKLTEWGFLVPIEWDEKVIRDYLKLAYITEPKLELVVHTRV